MAVFAPIKPVDPIPPLQNDKGWAIGFWDYDRSVWTEEYGCFYPKNMTFSFGVDNKFIADPGVNATLVTQEYYNKTIIPSEAARLADIFIDNAVPTPGGDNRHVLDNTFIFDYGNRSQQQNRKLIINGILNPFLPVAGAMGGGVVIRNANSIGLDLFLPTYISEIIWPQKGFIPQQDKPLKKVTYDSLLQYACRYLYTPSGVSYYHDCIRALPIEYTYMSPNRIIKFNNEINLANKVADHRLIFNMRNTAFIDRQSDSFNDCERCKKWVVYCGIDGENWPVNSRIFAKLFHEKDSTSSLYVGVNYPEDEYLDNNNSAIYFKDKESAYEFFDSFKDKKKWIADPSGEACCIEINEYCCQFQGSGFDEKCYSSQDECAEENLCGSGSDEVIQRFSYNSSTKTWIAK